MTDKNNNGNNELSPYPDKNISTAISFEYKSKFIFKPNNVS